VNNDECPWCHVEGKWDALFRRCYACGISDPVPSRFGVFIRIIRQWLT
jgi:hypothetical protein